MCHEKEEEKVRLPDLQYMHAYETGPKNHAWLLDHALCTLSADPLKSDYKPVYCKSHGRGFYVIEIYVCTEVGKGS